MSLKRRYKTINGFKNNDQIVTNNLIKDKNDPRIKKLEKLKGWKLVKQNYFPISMN